MRGSSLVLWLVIIALIFPFARTGFQVLKEYYHFYEIQAQVHQLVKVGTALTEDEIKAKLREILLDANSFLRVEDFEIHHSRDEVQMKTAWRTKVKFDFYGQFGFEKELNFQVSEKYPN